MFDMDFNAMIVSGEENLDAAGIWIPACGTTGQMMTISVRGENEMRLIDANKLKEDVLDLPNCPNEYSDTYDKAMILDLVDEQPTVDAEPVVKCENCKWFGEEDEDGECWCFLNDVSTLRYGFCYWGKRNDK